MLQITSLILAFGLSLARANTASGPALREMLRGSSVLGDAKIIGQGPSEGDEHERCLQLVGRSRVRLLMLHSDLISGAVAAFGDAHPVMSDEVAGTTLCAIARLESKMSQRFGLSLARISEETDFLIDLAELTWRGAAAADLTRSLLTARAHESLGPTYHTFFLKCLATLRVRNETSLSSDLVAPFLPNLANQLRRGLQIGRAAVTPEDRAARALLYAPPPPRAGLSARAEISVRRRRTSTAAERRDLALARTIAACRRALGGE